MTRVATPLLLTALGFTAACAGNPPPPMIGGGPVPAGRAGIETDSTTARAGKSRIAPATNYRAIVRLERHDSIILTLPDGRQQLQETSRRARFSVAVNVRGDITVRLDSLAFTPAVPSASNEAIGTSWEGKLGQHGIDDLHPNRKNGVTNDMTSTVKELLPNLPLSGVALGTTWMDTTSSDRRVEIFDARDDRRSRWEVGQSRSLDGLQVHPITVVERYEQLGKGEQAGREMRMSAQGSRTATYYSTIAGRVDRLVQVDSANRLITIPETRQAIPTTQVIRTIVTFRYQP